MGRKFATLALAGLFVLAPVAANAAYTSTTACTSGVGTIGSTFTGVESALLSAKFTNQKDQTNLLSKLSTAYNKALSGKFIPDAVAKLEDISNTANALASAFPKPKLDSLGADAIDAAVLTAQACLTPI